MDQATGNGNSGFERAAGSPSTDKITDRTLTDLIKEEPIACLAIAVAAGFLVGGGAKRAGGLTILTMLGQIVVREAFGSSASLSDLLGQAQEKPHDA